MDSRRTGFAVAWWLSAKGRVAEGSGLRMQHGEQRRGVPELRFMLPPKSRLAGFSKDGRLNFVNSLAGLMAPKNLGISKSSGLSKGKGRYSLNLPNWTRPAYQGTSQRWVDLSLVLFGRELFGW